MGLAANTFVIPFDRAGRLDLARPMDSSDSPSGWPFWLGSADILTPSFKQYQLYDWAQSGWHLELAQPSISSLQLKLDLHLDLVQPSTFNTSTKTRASAWTSWPSLQLYHFNFLLRRCLCTQGHSLPVLPLGQPSVWHRRLDSTFQFSSMADGASTS